MRFFLLFSLLSFCVVSKSQVLIDDAKQSNENPDGNAILELRSEFKGLLLPRLTTSVINQMENVKAGTLIFDKDEKVFKGYNGDKWVILSEVAPENDNQNTPPVSGELLTETFDGLAGNNTAPKGGNSKWKGNHNFPQEGLVNVSQAGGAIKLGTGEDKGSITSRELSFENKPITVTLDVKGWSEIENDIIVSINEVSKIIKYANTRNDSFVTKSATFGGIVGNAKVKIATSERRAYIDNIHIRQ